MRGTNLHPLASLVLLALAAAAGAAPEAVAWERWRTHDDTSTTRIDHSPWTRFLASTVVESEDGIHRLRYGAVVPEDRRLLASYLEALEGTPISRYARSEQLPFWINLYNALTVQVVLDHHPVQSIREISISPGLFTRGPWGAPLAAIEGEELSLDDIEHRILRPLWRDPRIHYALNCASIGCPNLAAEAFTAQNLQRLLDAGARAYVNHPRGVAFEGGELRVSSIYVWFADDFGGEPGVLDHLRTYAQPRLASRLQTATAIDDDRYDWTLNEAR